MLQSPPLANMLPFHHAAVHAAVHAAAAAQQQQQQQQHHHQQESSPSSQGSTTQLNSSENSSIFSHHPSGLSHLLGAAAAAGSGAGVLPPAPPASHLQPHPHLGSPHHQPGLPPPPPHPPHLHPGQFPGGPHPGHPGAHFGMEHFRPRFLFRMPRVVPNQKEKFESDDLMKRHSREGEVRFTGYRDRPLHERQSKFLCGIREGHTEIAFIATGFNLMLAFDPTPGFNPANRQCDFEKEPGKVHLKSPFILNGVCVRWKGYVDLERLDGVGCLEFDDESAAIEDAILKDTVEAYNRRMKEFEEHTKARSRQIAAFMGHHQAAAAAAAAHAHAAAAAQAAAASAALSSNTSASTTTTTSPSLAAASISSPGVTSSTTSNNNNTLIGQNPFFNTSHLGNSHSPTSNALSSNSTITSHADLLEVRKKQLELSSLGGTNTRHSLPT